MTAPPENLFLLHPDAADIVVFHEADSRVPQVALHLRAA